eukprot:TRINITY_DN1511_c0_g2_i7.p1 TRINITY_DN1511_c0_g2~~TRINITY_DN1511_c0_g2_i7.p1  ORF type:complete len:465 (-),score=82.15 TRINITY_DN1511_c0_g2_i7:110-1504(-)
MSSKEKETKNNEMEQEQDKDVQNQVENNDQQSEKRDNNEKKIKKSKKDKKKKKTKDKDSSSPSKSKNKSKKKKKKKQKSSSSSRASSSVPSKKSKSKSKKKPKRKSTSKSKKVRSRSYSKKRHHRSRDREREREKEKERDRDREREREKEREREREREREKERERERPKSKEKKKGRFSFDSPPKELKSQFEPKNEMFKNLSRIMTTKNPQEIIQRMEIINAYSNLQASKVDRKLYVGNLPPNMTQSTLVEILNQALRKMNVNTHPPGNSIISAWISPDGHYSFVEFRTPEEANNGFALNNVAIFGQPLKVGRPRAYAASQNMPSPFEGLLNPLAGLGEMGGDQQTGTPNQSALKVQPPSRILVLKNIVEIHELEIDEEYASIMEDIKEECEKYGKVLSLKIPRPKKDEEIPGLGKIFVEFEKLEQSKDARKALTGKIFADHTVETSYFDEEKYAKDDLKEDTA